jgi:tryptophan synthase beta chain
MECEIHMGAVDIEKQALNVYKMRLLGANVVSVDFGLKTLKEAVDSALIAWNNDLDNSFYLIGSAVGPHPYPTMVRDFQKIIGKEIKAQINLSEKRNPDYIIACVGGGSNAIGAFYEFINNKEVNLIGVEAAGEGLNTNKHSAAISLGKKGLLHGMKTKVLLDDDGNIKEVHSIAAGLDYPGVGPEHAYLESIKRVKYVAVTNEDAIEAFKYLSKTEGIIPAIESAHAVAYAIKLVKNLSKDKIVVINLSGRGDKDVKHIAKYLGEEIID